ncbi:50S ribosome-binding GTPase [Corynebacterium sp. CCUG 65737]|uniref:dynamin family protein n=1 Tax=Corynebacterium sp. CCUG 65737 TaxID=2823889 RepID=UPI00210923F0|nr:dynamin family protein [Corynebacterium sp. CCUG 65737]MCQ4627805.1 50S ribosome-binding GTPase [Corynebacterium sp. CCUG 65737]
MSQPHQNGAEALNVLLRQSIEALGQGGPHLEQPAAELRELVSRPPRVAVIGRLKSGKSTLVNALTESRIAATGSLECTMAVSVYDEGAPARAEVIGLDGKVQSVPLAGEPLADLGRPLDEIDFVRQFIPIARLATLGIIDTPGTATLTVENEARTRRMLIDGSQDTKRASSWADCVVFLSDSAPRDDERAFVADLGMTPLTVVGVVSRADSFGAGAFGQKDPLEVAQAYAGRIAEQMGGTVGAMVPLSGLLAESALTGRVTGAVVRDVAALAGLDRDAMLEFVEAEDPSTSVEGFTADERDHLLDVMGEYGLMYGRTVAAEQGPAGLLEWMKRTSGIERLTTIITEEMPYFATLQRAVRVVDALDTLSNAPESRDHALWVQSVLESQPAMKDVMLYRSFKNTVADSPNSTLIPRLRAAIQGSNPAQKVGLRADAPPERVIDVLRSELGELRELAMTPLSAAEDDARERLIVAYQAAWKRMTR